METIQCANIFNLELTIWRHGQMKEWYYISSRIQDYREMLEGGRRWVCPFQPQRALRMLRFQFQTRSFNMQKKIAFYCFSHTFCGHLSRQPRKLNGTLNKANRQHLASLQLKSYIVLFCNVFIHYIWLFKLRNKWI